MTLLGCVHTERDSLTITTNT